MRFDVQLLNRVSSVERGGHQGIACHKSYRVHALHQPVEKPQPSRHTFAESPGLFNAEASGLHPADRVG
jgi:hypothetical protein